MARDIAPRARKLTLKNLQEIAEKLESLQGEIRACRDALEMSGLKDVTFDGGGKFERGIDVLVEFNTKLEGAVKLAKYEKHK